MFNTPIIDASGNVFIHVTGGYANGLDATTGAIMWHYLIPETIATSALPSRTTLTLGPDGTVYLLEGQSITAKLHALVAA